MTKKTSRPLNEGYQARPPKKLIQNGYQPTSGGKPATPPTGGSSVKPKK